MSASRPPASPQENYGILPSLEMTLFVITMAFSLTCLSAAILTDQVGNRGFDGWITLALFTILTGAHMFVLVNHLGRFKETYHNHKKLHYYRKHIKPYIQSRYGIDLRMNNINDIRLLAAGRLSVDPENAFTGIKGFFLSPSKNYNFASAPWGHAKLQGAALIDDIASGQRSEPLGADEIILLRREDHMLTEFGRVDVPEATPVEVLNDNASPKALYELEQSITHRVHEIFATTKGGDFYLRVNTPGSDEEPSQLLADASFIRDDSGNATYYRAEEVASVVNSLVFAIRLYGRGHLSVVRVDTHNRGTVSGVVFYESASRAMRENELNSLRTSVGKNFSCGVPEYRWSPHLS